MRVAIIGSRAVIGAAVLYCYSPPAFRAAYTIQTQSASVPLCEHNSAAHNTHHAH